MTPKEKAKSLVRKQLTAISEEIICSDEILHYTAKQSALITVNELIVECTLHRPSPEPRFDYLNEVKKEIEKL